MFAPRVFVVHVLDDNIIRAVTAHVATGRDEGGRRTNTRRSCRSEYFLFFSPQAIYPASSAATSTHASLHARRVYSWRVVFRRPAVSLGSTVRAPTSVMTDEGTERCLRGPALHSSSFLLLPVTHSHRSVLPGTIFVGTEGYTSIDRVISISHHQHSNTLDYFSQYKKSVTCGEK